MRIFSVLVFSVDRILFGRVNRQYLSCHLHDENVNTDENNEHNTIIDKHIQLNVNELSNFINNYLIKDFVSSKTIRFFERLNISFIETDPSKWNDNLDYCMQR